MPSSFSCPYCKRGGFKACGSMNLHVQNTDICQAQRDAERRQCSAAIALSSQDNVADGLNQVIPVPDTTGVHSFDTPPEFTCDFAMVQQPLALPQPGDIHIEDLPPDGVTYTIPPLNPSAASGEAVSEVVPDVDAQVPSITVEDVLDEDSYYDGTPFQKIRDEQVLQGAEVLGPFQSNEEWELAKWLIKNVGHNQAESFLKLPIIQDRTQPKYHNKDDLLKAIDSLPGVTGDLLDDNGAARTEEFELWCCDPLECIKELIGNPAFRDHMKYAPECVYEDVERKEEVINETWTASWWWQLQEVLPPGATIAPVILSSDKTQLSRFRGDKSAWPVYLTIGNISKDVRQKASSHATVLVGYLPVSKLDCYSEKVRKFAWYRLFHDCMRIFLNSLIEPGKSGIGMTCADGFIRRVHPILAAYVADYPEQCLIACCMENHCPLCKVAPTDRGSPNASDPRTANETIAMMARKAMSDTDPEFNKQWTDLGICPIFRPFWMDLPHSDIFQSFTPDLLHQLHKGMFKDHLVSWVMDLVGSFELDECFKVMTDHPGLRHFKNGISSVSQWTGAEHKAMEKVFLPLIVGAVQDDVVRAVHAILDFIYYASLQSHTTSTLAALRNSCIYFHDHKDVFVQLQARQPPHFNIPKLHSMLHYVELIHCFGSADGFNTESLERLHIDYAKEAYRASNGRDYTIQMTKWLAQQEAIDRFSTYLKWCADCSEGAFNSYSTLKWSRCQVVTTTRTSYRVPANHPQALRGITAGAIVEKNGATIRVIPRHFDSFNLFKRLVFELPDIPEAKPSSLKNVVHASPPIPGVGRRPAEAAHLDSALIKTALSSIIGSHKFQGLHVAHIRAIFSLPAIYGVLQTTPLAYIEWLTPFATPNSSDGLYHLTRSTRRHHVYAEIIDVE
ncbi:hypothetical protein BT96DRAFT_960766 [Gymnopus androsaceus JB14]|uniref:Uncharacterized protein n=1 Tax=Gymnopus androsaceus JB14 TaxID=1447944 RepID=A0A6A4GIF5_9AGAR|nr:hypothetical protein BT96DRAFT_960766 [Gymnopus androsaceus JB14]